ncbi:hypothetical protein IMSAGC022_00237 [Alistipes sp.]|nr:hypothetical protein IMSAGC022_00237 [Alistipes sp.]
MAFIAIGQLGNTITRIYNSRNYMAFIALESTATYTQIYNSRNYMAFIARGWYTANPLYHIYNSRNYMAFIASQAAAQRIAINLQ